MQTSRPVLHIQPVRGWLNDPNGMTRHNGRWHVFFQHNPASARHGLIHWGHVSSGDLVTWTEHPVAFGPTAGGPDRGGCWSGSFLHGWEGAAVAYTGVVGGPETTTVCRRQALDDELVGWSEPIVVGHQPLEAGVAVMRDPYPFEWRGRRFALLGAGLTDGTPALLLFSCDDPDAWRFENVWLTGRDVDTCPAAAANVWECPQLVRVGGRWLLVLSLWVRGVLEDVVYLLGALVGDPRGSATPRFEMTSTGLLDHGPDFYAAHLLDEGGGRPLLVGWVREEEGPIDAPPDQVAGCLTLPRRIVLQDETVSVTVDPALDALMSRRVALVEDRETASELGRIHPLPRLARATVAAPDGVALCARDADQPWHMVARLTGPPCDIWIDGEVVEVYRQGAVPHTIRRAGASGWALGGSVEPASTSVWTLEVPGLPA